MLTQLTDTVASFLFRHDLRGASRFARTFIKNRRIMARSKHGLVWYLDPAEYVDRFVLTHGFYEEEVLEAVVSRIGQGDCFWDVGANLGLHALTVKRAAPSVSVYAFEPNPKLNQLISRVAQLNGLEVQISPIALDQDTRTADFFICEGNLGNSSLFTRLTKRGVKVIKVQTELGDELVQSGRVTSPNIVKIDAEGNEYRIMAGMSKILQTPQLHTIVLEDGESDFTPVKSLLSSYGFTFKKLVRKEPTHHNLHNYLAIRQQGRTANAL